MADPRIAAICDRRTPRARTGLKPGQGGCEVKDRRNASTAWSIILSGTHWPSSSRIGSEPCHERVGVDGEPELSVDLGEGVVDQP